MANSFRPREPAMMQITIRLPYRLVRRIEAEAAKARRDRSDYLRELIVEAVSREPRAMSKAGGHEEL